MAVFLCVGSHLKRNMMRNNMICTLIIFRLVGPFLLCKQSDEPAKNCKKLNIIGQVQFIHHLYCTG